MFLSLLILVALPFADLGRSKGFQFRPISKVAFWVFVVNFLILMKLGACHVETPFIELGQVSSVLYFSYFIFILPAVSIVENTLVDLYVYNTNKSASNELTKGMVFSKVSN